MTTIDQAFIRAYLQQTARDVPKCDVEPKAAAPGVARVDRTDRPQTRPCPVSQLVTSSTVEPIHSAVTVLMTETLSEPVCLPQPAPAAPRVERPAAPRVELRPVKVEQPAVEAELLPVEEELPPVQVELPPVEVERPPVKVELPPIQVERPAVKEVPPAAKVEPPPKPVAAPPAPVAEEPASENTTETVFQPMLQVDGFAWSERATSLRLAAGIQVDRLADSLAEGIAAGRNVAAIAGCGRHQGCTTMLLCVAKRLADRGLKVAVVDADFAHPALAANLGLLPEEGFEAVLAGRASIEDVAIESAGDEMTVVPVAAPAAAQAESPEGVAAQEAAIEILRRRYDLVLADVGEVAGRRGVPRWVDAVVLIQDVRATAQAEVAQIVRQIANAGVVNLGVVENFV